MAKFICRFGDSIQYSDLLLSDYIFNYSDVQHMLERVRFVIGKCPRFVIDHLCIDMEQRADRFFDFSGMFLRPPFGQCWLENIVDNRHRWGWLIERQRDGFSIDVIYGSMRDFGWMGVLRVTTQNDIMAGNHQGFLNRELNNFEEDITPYQALFSHCIPALYTLSLLNCRGVRQCEFDTSNMQKFRRKRNLPNLSYRTLVIGKTNRSTWNTEQLNAYIRAHVRRGNVATYTPEKPHVSGFVGQMWREPCVVKGKAKGTVVKDYDVRG